MNVKGIISRKSIVTRVEHGQAVGEWHQICANCWHANLQVWLPAGALFFLMGFAVSHGGFLSPTRSSYKHILRRVSHSLGRTSEKRRWYFCGKYLWGYAQGIIERRGNFRSVKDFDVTTLKNVPGSGVALQVRENVSPLQNCYPCIKGR